jgi:hypothetical protein
MTALTPDVPRGLVRAIPLARSAIGSAWAALRLGRCEVAASPATEPPGWIDGITLKDDGIFIHGWARSVDDAPARIFCSYDGAPYGSVIADTYRPELDAAITGSQYVGFDIPLPGDPQNFEQKRFEARHENGTALGQATEFLAWNAAEYFKVLENVDIYASPITKSAFVEITSRCNLRCVYCAVSQPQYVGQDMEAGLLDETVQILKTRDIGFIVVNAHGETTIVPGWHHRVNELAAAGIELQIITNFARLLLPEELAAMARIKTISISIDTHRPEVLRRIRRHVSLGNILINMTNTRAKAAELGLQPPKFIWNCVMTDKVAFDFVDYLRFGLTLGIREFFVANLTKHDDVAGAENVNHVTMLPDADLQRFARMVEQGREMVQAAGGYLEISAGLAETMQQELAARGLQ